MRLPFMRRKRTHRWKIVYVGDDLLRYFDEDLKPPWGAAAGDVAIGKGCIMRVCRDCGKREIIREVAFEDGPASDHGEEEG